MGVMHPPLPRREFLKLLSRFGAACACGGMAVRLAADQAKPGGPKLPDLKTRAYCGLICDDSCPLFTEWKWKEKFGVEFNPDQVFCYGCKAPGKPENIPHSRCTVLKCSTERKLESCLECQKLAGCDKELWKSWPDFHQQMIKLQQMYAATDGFKIS